MGESDEREEREQRGFRVVDRRGRSDEETSEPSPPPRPERPREAAPRGGEAHEGPGFTLVDEPGGEPPAAGAEPLPPVDFAGLALSLASSALYHLGLVADPQSGEPGPVDLRLARHTIDTLQMLEDKTRGNLDPEEAQLLSNLLTELRMRFVEASRGA